MPCPQPQNAEFPEHFLVWKIPGASRWHLLMPSQEVSHTVIDKVVNGSVGPQSCPIAEVLGPSSEYSVQAGRRPELHFRGLPGIHSRCGPQARSPTPSVGVCPQGFHKLGCPAHVSGSSRAVPTVAPAELSSAGLLRPRGALNNPGYLKYPRLFNISFSLSVRFFRLMSLRFFIFLTHSLKY